MKRLKIEDFGTKVQGISLRGDVRNPEPETVRVSFPGGDVDVVRNDDGSYWVHVRVDSADDVKDEAADVAGALTDARLDVRGKSPSETSVGDFGNANLYHLAVRVAVRR